MPDVTMPRLSDSMEEGTILKWLVSEGDEVKKGQEIVEIETDKANMTYEADADGVISFVASEGDTVELGGVIAKIGEGGGGSEDDDSDDGGDAESEDSDDEDSGESEEDDSDEEDGDDAEKKDSDDEDSDESEGDEDDSDSDDDGDSGEDDASSDEKGADEEETGSDEKSEGGDEPSSNGSDRVKASPVAKRIAEEKGVEISSLSGSGPGGRIVKSDVEDAADGGGDDESADEAGDGEEPKPDDGGPKGQVEEVELSRLQRTVSRRMAESKATAPDYTLSVEVDMTGCVELRERLKDEDPEQVPSFNDMIVKASAMALREHKRVNGAYRDGQFELYSRVNVGVAVAAQDALVVPTIFDADQKSLGQIARDAHGLIEKVREGKITPPELSGGTFTVSNLGMYGIDTFTAVINPPQAAILAVGSLKKRPVVEEESGRVIARDTIWLNLISDHRILYGADGAEFLARIRELLESPLQLAL
jgi:pyruvate dehydrogenase E2 component (dihydrolipoamide acetyltransferase)